VGGHLALHLAVSHPERFAGLLLIDPLGADPGVFAETDANLRRGLSDARREGEVSEADLVERFALVWPQYFLRPENATPPPGASG
jgi:pimeloyl-ACP methyl ester carboxylesterase